MSFDDLTKFRFETTCSKVRYKPTETLWFLYAASQLESVAIDGANYLLNYLNYASRFRVKERRLHIGDNQPHVTLCPFQAHLSLVHLFLCPEILGKERSFEIATEVLTEGKEFRDLAAPLLTLAALRGTVSLYIGQMSELVSWMTHEQVRYEYRESGLYCSEPIKSIETRHGSKNFNVTFGIGNTADLGFRVATQSKMKLPEVKRNGAYDFDALEQNSAVTSTFVGRAS